MAAGGSRTQRRSLFGRLYDRPYLLLILTSFGWGANSVASRMAVGQMSPMTLTSARWGLVLVLLLISFRRLFAENLPLVRKQWVAGVLGGAGGVAGFGAGSGGAARCA